MIAMKVSVETALVLAMAVLGAFGTITHNIVTHAPLPVGAEPSVVEMGRVPSGTVAQGTFRLVNRSDHAVRLVSTRTSCGCTATNPPKTLNPGASADIPVTMATAGRAGTVEQTISVVLEGYPDRPLSIPVRVTVDGTEPKPVAEDGTCKAP
ncbi:DUF1573 domain-containing protein [bacterium]|nr:MAG: DUF1573 domain-containing protein [bacterium]